MTEGRSDGHDDCEVEDERGRGSRGRKFGIPRNKVNVNKNAEQEEKLRVVPTPGVGVAGVAIFTNFLESYPE